MATNTTRLGLIKPNGNEALDVTDLNENFQILDDTVPATGGFSKSGATVKMGFDGSTYHWHLITICCTNADAMGAWLVYFTTNGTPRILQLAKASGVTSIARDGNFGLVFTFDGDAASATKQFNDISFRGAKYLGYNYE